MIEKCESLKAAEKVLQIILRNKLSKELDGTIESYQNGREQGYIIWQPAINGKAFYIAQYRRSDNIVIYYGKYSMQSLSDEAYKNAKYFKYNEYRKAAKYILETMLANQSIYNLGG